jgi:hypothetical protein
MLLFALVGTALPWMHFAIRRMERARLPELETLPELPEMLELHRPRGQLARERRSVRVRRLSVSRSAPADRSRLVIPSLRPDAPAPSRVARMPAGR